MKKKNYDDGTPGIVGTVLQNLNGHLLVRGDFYIDKNSKKTLTNGNWFAVHDVCGLVNYFEGDLIKIEKNRILNLTEQRLTCSFSEMLSKEELALCNGKKQEFIFNGFIEQMNILSGDVAIRFHVINRINSEGVMLRADKIVSFCKRCEQNKEECNHFLTSVFSVPLKKSQAVKYTRECDENGKLIAGNVVLLGITPLKNARTFLKKNCR